MSQASIHTRLKFFREQKNLTHQQVAVLLGVSRAAVYLWEKEPGGTAPKRTLLPKVAEIYGVTAQQLLSGVENFGADDAEDNVSLGTPAVRLRYVRKLRGLSQMELAQKAGLATGTIGNIEAGSRGIKSSALDLAKALNVDPGWLATGTGPMLGQDNTPQPALEAHSTLQLATLEALSAAMRKGKVSDQECIEMLKQWTE